MSKGADLVAGGIALCMLLGIIVSFPVSLVATAYLAVPLAGAAGLPIDETWAFWLVFGGVEFLLLGLILLAGFVCARADETK